MKISVIAVGRAKSGPELTLIENYRTRFDAIGRGIALGPLDIVEIDSRRSDREVDSVKILEKIPKGYHVIALDERGKTQPSSAFSAMLCDIRDGGAPGIAFLIGGADGHSDAIRATAQRQIAYGPATWPHMLVRVMLTEQIYRAAAIAANHPYHREG